MPQESNLESHSFPAIFLAGLLAGCLDITAAFITWQIQGFGPSIIMKGIASGLLGPTAFDGGWQIAMLGLACHFFIAFSAATVFYVASRSIKFMTSRPVVSGIFYGMAVYVVMYWIVVPLSRVERSPVTFWGTVVAILTHIVCVGIPISLVVRRHSR
jgi:hypothetical protein